VPKKVDACQPETVGALRRVGAAVLDIHEVGHGAPDLVVWYRGRYYLIELKSGNGRLTPDEQAWHASWPGEVHIVRSWQAALLAVGVVVE
jgi:hypothetical protein